MKPRNSSVRWAVLAAWAAAGSVMAAGCSQSASPLPVPTVTTPPAASHLVYITDVKANCVWVFPDRLGAPLYGKIGGPSTALAKPLGVTTDSAGNVWVANTQSNSVLEFAAKKVGNLAPLVTIVGANTTLSQPAGIAVDSAGNVWVANVATNSLVEFAAGASGNVAPINTITSTVLENPNALAFDPSGLLWVSDFSQTGFDAGNISAFNETQGLNATPVSELDGNNGVTGVSVPTGISFDALGDLFAGQFGSDTVKEYPPPVGGSEPPNNVIGAGVWSGYGPWGVAVGPSGTLYGVDNDPLAGDPSPVVRTYAGGNFDIVPTHMLDPMAVAVH